MKNCKEKFDERMRDNFGKEKSRKVFQDGYSKAYRLLSCVPTWKKLMDVLINTVLWFVIVKVFNHIDPIEEGLYKGTNSFIYLAKSLPLTLAFYPIGAYVSRCLLNRKYNRCSYIQKFGVWPKIFLFSAVWIGIITQMDAYAPRLPLYLHSGYRTVLAGAYALLEGAVPGSWQREKRKEYRIRKLRIIEEEKTGGNKVWNFYNRQWIISGEIF